MDKKDDYVSEYFASRRKQLDTLLTNIDAFFQLPSEKQTDIKRLNNLLYIVAFRVKEDNDVLEKLTLWNNDTREHLGNILSIVSSLSEQMQKIKGLDTPEFGSEIEKLKREVKELMNYKPTLETLKESVEKMKKWTEDIR